ncbi:MAG: hypothetical protein J5I92_14460 [Thiogranum sp.]|nr:hypothetical protein [Thiogranum sp.]
MAKRSQKPGNGAGAGKRQAAAPAAGQAAKPGEDEWNDVDDADAGDEWPEITVRERDSSRIRRQMEARRKLEQLMEAKRLSSLVDDWSFSDDWQLSEERS